MFLVFPLHFVYYIVHSLIRRPQAAADSSAVSFVAACWMFAPLARIQHLLPGHSWGVCRCLGSDFDKLEGTRLIDGMQWSIQTHSSGDLVWKTQKSRREIWGFRLKFSTCSSLLSFKKELQSTQEASVLSHKSTPKQEEILSNPYRIFVVIPLTSPKSENRGRL